MHFYFDGNFNELKELLTNQFVSLGYQQVQPITEYPAQNYLSIFCYEWDNEISFNFYLPDELVIELQEEHPKLQQFLALFTEKQSVPSTRPKQYQFLHFLYPLHKSQLDPFESSDPEIFYPTGLRMKDNDCVLHSCQLCMGVKKVGFIFDGKILGFNSQEEEGIGTLIKFSENDFYLIHRNASFSNYEDKSIKIMRSMAESFNPYAMALIVLWKMGNRFKFRLPVAKIKEFNNIAVSFNIQNAIELNEAIQSIPSFEEHLKQVKEKAEKGCYKSHFMLANYYHRGESLERDDEKAIFHYNEALNEPDYILSSFYNQSVLQRGQNYVDDMVDEADTVTIDWLKKRSENDDVVAQFLLGFLYNDGLIVEEDKQKALELYERSADLGYGKSQNNLAEKYRKGDGVKQDYQKAFNLYVLSAKQNIPEAFSNLEEMYREGTGVAVDNKKADLLAEKAKQYELYRF